MNLKRERRKKRNNNEFTQNNVQPECIKACKVYDWTILSSSGWAEATIDGECAAAITAALNPPPGADPKEVSVECRIDPDALPKRLPFSACSETQPTPGCGGTCSISKVKHGVNIDSTDQAAVVQFIQNIPVELIVKIDGERPRDTNGNFVCTSDTGTNPVVRIKEETVLCLPKPLSKENISCRIFDAECEASCLVTNDSGETYNVTVEVTLCKDVHVEAKVVLEVEAKFCQPRLPMKPPTSVCPIKISFPPQCPSFFPVTEEDECELSLNDPGMVVCNGMLTGLITCNNGVPQPNVSVSFTTSSPNVIINPNPTTSDVNGIYTADIIVAAGTSPTNVTITAMATVDGEVLADNVTISASCPATCEEVGITLNQISDIMCTGTISGTVTCDGVGQENVMVTLTANPPNIITFSDPVITDMNGNYTASIMVPPGTPSTNVMITASATIGLQTESASINPNVECPSVTCSNATISLESPTSIECTGTITGNVSCDEGAQAGVMVTLSANPNDITFNPPSPITDAMGNYTATITASPGTSSNVMIVASATVDGQTPMTSMMTAVDCPCSCDGTLAIQNIMNSGDCDNTIITGDVTCDGIGIGGVLVSYFADNGGDIIFDQTTTAGDGTFTFNVSDLNPEGVDFLFAAECGDVIIGPIVQTILCN